MDTMVVRFENTVDLEASIFDNVKFSMKNATIDERTPRYMIDPIN